MKKVLLVVGFGLVIAAPCASADVIFSDDFNRTDNAVVGNSWLEIQNDANDVAIRNNRLRLRDVLPGTGLFDIDAAASQMAIDTTGFFDIMLAFQWKRIDDESVSADKLLAAYCLGSCSTLDNTGWMSLPAAGLGLGSSTLASASFSLAGADNNPQLNIRFWTRISNHDDADEAGALIDNVSITGVIPEPEIYAMLLAGLGLMGFVVRRRRQHAAGA